MDNKNLEITEATATKSKSKTKKLIIIITILVIVIVAAIVLTFKFFIPMIQYNKAMDAIDSGDYDNAYKILKELDGYKDSKKMLKDFKTAYTKAEITYYDESGNITSKSTNTYDENGEIIASKWNDGISGAGGHYTHTYTYEYFPNGDKKSCTAYDKNNEVSFVETYEYRYSESGHLIVDEFCNGDLILTSEYDKNGNLMHKMIRDGKITHYYEYDEYDIITREYERKETGFVGMLGEMKNLIKYDIKYKYDELDNIESVSRYLGDTLICKAKYSGQYKIYTPED